LSEPGFYGIIGINRIKMLNRGMKLIQRYWISVTSRMRTLLKQDII
jgi:hypothetical protein